MVDLGMHGMAHHLSSMVAVTALGARHHDHDHGRSDAGTIPMGVEN